MFDFKVTICCYAIAVSLTFCLGVDLNDKCSGTQRFVKCLGVSLEDDGIVDSENIRIEDSVVLVNKTFLQKFPNAVVMEFYRVNVTFDLVDDDESSLKKLSIDSSELSLGISDGLRELEVLSVRNTRNGVKLLENLTSLNKLALLNANISNISLGNLTNLHWLDLSGNNLKAVPDSIPTGVTYLDLSGNVIERVNRENFEDLRNLEILLLENNKIAEVSKDTFEGLPNLQRLFLSNNTLTSSEFVKDLNLKFLDLSFNKISNVEEISESTRLILEKAVVYEKSKTASHISVGLVIVFCGLVLSFIFYCGK